MPISRITNHHRRRQEPVCLHQQTAGLTGSGDQGAALHFFMEIVEVIWFREELPTQPTRRELILSQHVFDVSTTYISSYELALK